MAAQKRIYFDKKMLTLKLVGLVIIAVLMGYGTIAGYEQNGIDGHTLFFSIMCLIAFSATLFRIPALFKTKPVLTLDSSGLTYRNRFFEWSQIKRIRFRSYRTEERLFVYFDPTITSVPLIMKTSNWETDNEALSQMIKEIQGDAQSRPY